MRDEHERWQSGAAARPPGCGRGGLAVAAALAWVYRCNRADRPRIRGPSAFEIYQQVTPIVVDGVMYLPAGDRVVALEPATGEELWTYELDEGLASFRGVAYWPGTNSIPRRIYFTSLKTLIALNAADGTRAREFGDDGEIDLVVAYSGVPTSWRDRTGNNVWAFALTLDEAAGLVYMPVSTPGANYYGGDRPGNNEPSNSVVALDALTGEVRWYFQIIHHELWDYNLPPAAALVDLTIDGRTIPALAQTGKSAWMFILDRRTGEPVFGVDEVPVPAGDVPGEWYSPTQPMPVRPPPVARVRFDPATDLVTAGGLVFIGATGDQRFRAFDSRSGSGPPGDEGVYVFALP